MRIVDANIVLRYLLEDNEKLSKQAAEIIDDEQIDLPVEVLCEVVFVLEKVYKATRADISNELTGFIKSTDAVLPYHKVVLLAFRYYAKTKLDFVDCILAGYAEVDKAEVHTFDSDLRKFIDRQAASK